MSDTGRPGFSVIICAYTEDRWRDLSKAILSVDAQTLPALETIVVADHNDKLRDRVAVAFPQVRVVTNQGRRGLSDARNSGVRVATGTVIAFLDDDAAAEPDWLARMAEVYADPDVIGVGGSADPVWSGARRPGWLPDEFDWVIGCSYRGQPTERAAVRNFLGCNMSFRRQAFALVGGFDPSVGRVGTRPVGCEETEFCIRLARRVPWGRLVYEPAARVRHRVPESRQTWRYFRTRCYSEGLSKAIVSGLAGSDAALATERRYAFVTLPRGVARNIAVAVTRRDLAGPARAAAILAGLGITAAGYAMGRLASRLRRRPQASESLVP
jgi:glycosyltransferase involved in cell wall biosynthesis